MGFFTFFLQLAARGPDSQNSAYPLTFLLGFGYTVRFNAG
jgi:hypothetical protein